MGCLCLTKAFNPQLQLHTLLYDDGDLEQLCLAEEQWEVLSPAAAEAAVGAMIKPLHPAAAAHQALQTQSSGSPRSTGTGTTVLPPPACAHVAAGGTVTMTAAAAVAPHVGAADERQQYSRQEVPSAHLETLCTWDNEDGGWLAAAEAAAAERPLRVMWDSHAGLTRIIAAADLVVAEQEMRRQRQRQQQEQRQKQQQYWQQRAVPSQQQQQQCSRQDGRPGDREPLEVAAALFGSSAGKAVSTGGSLRSSAAAAGGAAPQHTSNAGAASSAEMQQLQARDCCGKRCTQKRPWPSAALQVLPLVTCTDHSTAQLGWGATLHVARNCSSENSVFFAACRARKERMLFCCRIRSLSCAAASSVRLHPKVVMCFNTCSNRCYMPYLYSSQCRCTD